MTGGGRLQVDIIRCDGVGMCAHLAPDLIGLDTWGYPIVTSEPLDPASARRARSAARSCPTRALTVLQEG